MILLMFCCAIKKVHPGLVAFVPFLRFWVSILESRSGEIRRDQPSRYGHVAQITNCLRVQDLDVSYGVVRTTLAR
jgi:hypothetical protein